MRIKFFVTALLTALAIQASAIEFISTTNYVSSSEESIDSEQWIFAKDITANGTHENDLFLLAGDVLNLHGNYEGNIWGNGTRSVTFKGHCDRNVRISGLSVRIDGTIDGNVMAMAETVTIGTNAVINGDLKVGAFTLVFEGSVSGDTQITTLRIATLDGSFGENVSIESPEIILARNAQFGGNLSYRSEKELFPDEETVRGELKRIQRKPQPFIVLDNFRLNQFWFFGAVLVGIPFISLFPMTTAMASQLIRKKPLKCLLVGMVASIALPFIALMSASSLIGVPLGTLMMASWGILLYIGRILTGLVLGGLILRSLGASIGRVLLSTALGLAIIYFSTIIPAIGIPLQMAALWMGMGALLISLMEKRRLILQVPQNLKQLEELRNNNPEENNP